MLRLNKMTDYAIRALRGIYTSENPVVTSVQISEKESVPVPVLFKVLRILNQGGIIRSRRGRGDKVGGYELAVDLKDITLLDIIRLMQGEPYFSECLTNEAFCCHQDHCSVHRELERINHIIVQECSQKSLLEIFDADASLK